MPRPAKILVGQWTGYDAPLLNEALEVVMAHDPDLQLTPLSSGIHVAVLGAAAPDMSDVLHQLPKTGVVIAPAQATLPTTHAPRISYELVRTAALGASGFAVQARVDHRDIAISLPYLTRSTQIHAVLAALALAHYRQLDGEEIAQAMRELAPIAGHGAIHDSMNGSRIFDESLQAGSEDMHDSLEALQTISGTRKIAIVSDCPELVHKTGQVAELVILVGKHMHAVQREAFLAGADVHCFDTAEEVSPWLTSFITPGDVILIKGRKENGLEKIVERLVL